MDAGAEPVGGEAARAHNKREAGGVKSPDHELANQSAESPRAEEVARTHLSLRRSARSAAVSAARGAAASLAPK